MFFVFFLAISGFLPADSSQSLSSKKCQEFYSALNDGSKFLEPSEKGYEEAKLDEFPYMAAIGWKKTGNEIEYPCSGILIDPNYIVGPAYCAGKNGIPPTSILIGALQLSNSTTDTIPIKNILIHPERIEKGLYNDIALFELERSVPNLPACIWTENEITDPESTLIIYDSNDTANKIPAKLIKIRTKFEPSEDCAKVFSVTNKLDKGILPSQICAAELNINDCRSNPPGALLIQKTDGKKTIPYAVGVSSFGFAGCRDKIMPSVYSKIPAYRTWIESIIWPSN